jgi:hypothetical protein
MKPSFPLAATAALLLGMSPGTAILARAEPPVSLLAPRDAAPPPAPIPLSAGDAVPAQERETGNDLGGGIVKAEPLPPPPPRGDGAAPDGIAGTGPDRLTPPLTPPIREARPDDLRPTETPPTETRPGEAPWETPRPLAAPTPMETPDRPTPAPRRVEAPIPLDTPAMVAPAAPPPLASRTTPTPLTGPAGPTSLAAPAPLTSGGLPAWVPTPMGPETKPFAVPFDGGKQAKAARQTAESHTADSLPADAAPGTYLRAARGALLAGRGTEARSALEMAQTRLLSRDVDAGQERFPSESKAVRDISDAIAALAANDRASSLRLIENASLSIGAPLN